MSTGPLLYGNIATHRRGRVLSDAVQSVSIVTLPDGPAQVVMFGEEYQKLDEVSQDKLLAWARAAGRLLLLVPPYSAVECNKPVRWSTERLTKAPHGGEGLGRLLASEVQYKLNGQLTTPAIQGATWPDLSTATALYRAHPASGILVVTCLPIWSLKVLEHSKMLREWLDALYELAGKATQKEEPPEQSPLRPEHYSVLIHLMMGGFQSMEEALEALSHSTIFSLSKEVAQPLIVELLERGLLTEATPNQKAIDALMDSPYAIYAEEVMRESPNEGPSK
jgi:hypothetical protein